MQFFGTLRAPCVKGLMRKRIRANWIRMPIGSAIVIATIAACSSQAPEPGEQNIANAMVVNNSIGPAATGNSTDSLQPVDSPTPPSETSAPTDSKSAEAAGEVVHRYVELIGRNQLEDARALWEDPEAATQFTNRLADLRGLRAEAGKPGNMEGAAGSSYVTVPIGISGTTSAGTQFRCAAKATLRRVNDVPGSTPRQRQWHIRTIEC